MPRRDPKPAIYGVIAQADPVVSVSDIAEELGISKQAVHQQIDDVVEEYTGVKSRVVGQTTVYWEEFDEFVRKQRFEPEYPGVETERIAKARAAWRNRLEKARRLQGLDSPSEDTLRMRAYLWNALLSMRPTARVGVEMGLSFPVSFEPEEDEIPTLKEVREAEPEVEISELPSNIQEDVVRRHYTDIPQFEVGWYGEVSLAALSTFELAQRVYLYKECGEWAPDFAEVDDEVLDAIYPTITQLSTAGEALDWLVGEMYDLRW